MHAQIVYPSAGQIIAVDPDIPPEAQRVAFHAQGAPPGARWRLDGRLLEAATWRPAPGRWRLALESEQGETLDQVQFEVRGAAQAVEQPAAE